MKDTRIVFGVGCTWWDNIQKVSKYKNGQLPCCPHCNGLLLEMKNEDEWFYCIDKYEAAGNSGYRKMVEWSRGKCFPNYGILEMFYREEKIKNNG